jgi:phosphoribosylamine--glycine ligase
MKILVLGNGGREHALVWKLRQSARVPQLYCAPGNGGIAEEAECLPVDLKSLESIVALGERLQPDLTVVGPELPLTLGVVDEFTRRGWAAFGPTKAAAQLESSKSFAKEFLQRHYIPTAPYAICDSVECLKGDELSFLVLSDGERVAPLVAAQDHKRVGDGDTGPNTGGMGAYSTADIVDDKMRDWLVNHIARPVVAGMKAEGAEYKGVLYCGLMMTARGPMVLEFNCRFGDPETQAILMRLESDLVDALEASIAGRVSDGDFKWSRDASVCVVMASGGYPGTFEVGKQISGLDQAAAIADVKVFHAGTSRRDGAFYTAGGRVLGVSARAPELKTAVERAYQACEKIRFSGAQCRSDIAARALKK